MKYKNIFIFIIVLLSVSLVSCDGESKKSHSTSVETTEAVLTTSEETTLKTTTEEVTSITTELSESEKQKYMDEISDLIDGLKED